ncbi:hypothetical protein ACVIM8_007564 [Bradyrhizobium sp. USDA 4529]
MAARIQISALVVAEGEPGAPTETHALVLVFD